MTFTGILAAVSLFAALGWKPLEKPPPATPPLPTPAAPTTPPQSAGQPNERPPQRSLAPGTMRDGLLSLLPREGAKVAFVALSESEPVQFEFEIARFLDVRGFHVLDPTHLQVGGRPFFGQNVYEADGVYVIEIGSDDGNRTWKHGPSITPTVVFDSSRDLAHLPPIARDLLVEPKH